MFREYKFITQTNPEAHWLVRRFVPKFFEQDISTGIPVLTEEGRKAIEEELSETEEYQLEVATPQVERANPTEAVQA